MDYELVRLADGAMSVRSLEHDETMHPGGGPTAEATALYVDQVRLLERLRGHAGAFVIWDVGLGAGANALTLMRAARAVPTGLHVLSFDHTTEPLRFAASHRTSLPHLEGYEAAVEDLLTDGTAEFRNSEGHVRWDVHIADFPALLEGGGAATLAKPHLILFDPWSPAKNPAMWTAGVFANLFKLLDPARPCVLPTYSRSTLLRVSLLLAGFWVGVGRPAGRKEETTLAANQREWISTLLDQRWLERAGRSPSAEPLWEPVYRQARLRAESLRRLQKHPQFQPTRPT